MRSSVVRMSIKKLRSSVVRTHFKSRRRGVKNDGKRTSALLKKSVEGKKNPGLYGHTTRSNKLNMLYYARNFKRA
jgi:hypothetical protein